jgi:hypothetical protein
MEWWKARRQIRSPAITAVRPSASSARGLVMRLIQRQATGKAA